MAEPYLDIQSAKGASRLPITDKPITIGRHPTNLIVLPDGMASRYHCVIEKAAEQASAHQKLTPRIDKSAMV